MYRSFNTKELIKVWWHILNDLEEVDDGSPEYIKYRKQLKSVEKAIDNSRRKEVIKYK